MGEQSGVHQVYSLKLSALIGINPTIGLDYQQDSEILRLIGCIKLRYSGLKAGTWTEQVDRAYEMVTGRKAN